MNPEDYKEWMTRGFPRPGDVLFTTEAPLGNVALYPKEGTYALAQRLVTLRANLKLLDPIYLLYYLLSDLGQRQVNIKATGSTAIGIRQSELRKVPVILPPLPEQRKIAEILSTWDEAIAKTEQLIAALRERKKGLMQRLLSGQVRFAGFDGEWSTIRLDERVQQFIVPMRDKPPVFRGEIPWCRIEDFDGVYLKVSKSGRCVDDEIVDEMNLKVYPVGTVLCSCSADLGRCAITTAPLVTNQTFIGLVTGKDLDNLFLYYYLIFNDHQLQRISSGTTIAYLSREQFEKFKITIPSTLSGQKKIAEVLLACDQEIETVQNYLDRLNKQKKGLMQRLLTGEVRLKV